MAMELVRSAPGVCAMSRRSTRVVGVTVSMEAVWRGVVTVTVWETEPISSMKWKVGEVSEWTVSDSWRVWNPAWVMVTV